MEKRTLEEFLSAYSEGKRHFMNWNFDEELSVRGMDLTDVYFENCFLFLDFRESKLMNSKFIRCNIKTADFRFSNLTNAMIKNCSVESTIFEGAKTDTLIFEENYCYGNTVNQNDFEKIFKNSEEFYTKIKLVNKFLNAKEIGNILTGVIISGEINANDLLIINNKIEIPILEVEMHNLISKQRSFAITISREFYDTVTWHELYGTELKIKNTIKNKAYSK
ncbi:pentapeptide repeat-containing protein [Aquimarina algiphila]|uniref:pentapeptide repeat-containing protein n=1 Tax=Aquimarina algiphila TaxID=2047982 RepID=UPI00232B4EF4|nr:pentapeptide repeat-containing protein [Aquimarina algiphila]